MKPVWLVAAVALAGFLVARRRRLEPTLLVGGAIAAAGSLVYGLGLIELPDLEQLLTDIGEALGPWTYLLVGTMAFLETGAFVGLLAPGETAVVVGGVVAGQGRISIVGLIALVWACSLAGDVVSFLIGRRLGRQFLVRHGPKVSITEERLQTVEQFYARHGGKAVFLGRFVGLVRAVSPFVAASSGMALRRFLPYAVLGTGLWGATFCLLGYAFWQSIGRVLDLAKTGTFALGTTIVVGVLLVTAWRRLRDPEQRARILAWMRAHPWSRPFVGPTRFVWKRVTPGDLGLELTTLLAVAAVGAFVLVGYLIELTPGELTPGDRRWAAWTARVDVGVVRDAADVLAGLAAPGVASAVLVAAALALLARREVVEALTLLAGLATVAVGLALLDGTERRPGPDGAAVDVSTFPSQTAALAVVHVAVAVAVARAVPGMASRAAVVVVAVVVAGAAGMGQVVLRDAWFSDVAAGWALGALAFASCGIAGLLVGFLRHNGGPAA